MKLKMFFPGPASAGRARMMQEKILFAFQTFSKRERELFLALCAVFIASAAGLFFSVNSLFLVDIPKDGGQLTEGLSGSPRFINPVLAVSQTEHDIAALVFSGLLRLSGNGDLIPDLAESYSVSPDGSEYTFRLKEGLAFHDGKPLTSADVRFTIEKVQDPGIRSLKRGSWEGVVVETPDDRTVVFTLPAPYAPFLENTTLGILPKHLFAALSSEEFSASPLNVRPVGSGPYRLDEIEQDSSGVAKQYDLVAFEKFALGKPHIEQIRLRFFANEEELLHAYESGAVDSMAALSPVSARTLANEGRGEDIRRAPLPRAFGIFFNQNEQKIFADASVRKALDISADRGTIVNDILFGYGSALLGPFPPGVLGIGEVGAYSPDLFSSPKDPLEEAREFLKDGGWLYDEEEKAWRKKTKDGALILEFSLSTSNIPELKLAAEALVRRWAELGARVTIKVFEPGELNQNIIRPRKYDALLFGEIVGRRPDPYAFWHSSQRLDPGLNVALYANASADKVLVELRESRGESERMRLAQEFYDILAEDAPAVFLYAPEFLYLASPRVKNVSLPPIMHPSERFSGIFEWYVETDTVWKIFAQGPF